MAQSNFFRLNLNDAWKGVLAAFATAIVANLYTLISDGWPNAADLLDSLRIGLYAAGGYILKNLFTNSDGQALKREQG